MMFNGFVMRVLTIREIEDAVKLREAEARSSSNALSPAKYI
jgi:hypothetical protein